jgi:hypothetical protein
LENPNLGNPDIDGNNTKMDLKEIRCGDVD